MQVLQLKINVASYPGPSWLLYFGELEELGCSILEHLPSNHAAINFKKLMSFFGVA